MSEVKHFSKLKKGMVNWMIPTMIEASLSGAKSAKQDKTGTIYLTYTDNTEETRKTDKDMCKDFESFFAVISFVQDGRN